MVDYAGKAGLSQLYLEYRSQLYKTALRFTGKIDQAEDLLSETWLRFTRRFKEYVPTKSKLTTYLFQIMRNIWFDTIRKNGSRSILSLEDSLDNSYEGNGFLPVVESALGVYDGTPCAEIKEQEQLVGHTLDHLPSKYRCLLVLRYWHGKNTTQISEEVRLDSATTRWRLHTAHKLFRQAYVELGGSFDNF